MKSLLLLIFTSLILFGCGDEKIPVPTTTPGTSDVTQSKPTEAVQTPAPMKPETLPETSQSMPTPVAAVVDKQMPGITGNEMLSRKDALTLARKSGCLACHTIEKKLVGPAWKDVAARYSGKPGSNLQLLEKVKKGGKGNWTEITGGAPMPPYFPRVSENHIKQLVGFILALNQ